MKLLGNLRHSFSRVDCESFSDRKRMNGWGECVRGQGREVGNVWSRWVDQRERLVLPNRTPICVCIRSPPRSWSRMHCSVSPHQPTYLSTPARFLFHRDSLPLQLPLFLSTQTPQADWQHIKWNKAGAAAVPERSELSLSFVLPLLFTLLHQTLQLLSVSPLFTRHMFPVLVFVSIITGSIIPFSSSCTATKWKTVKQC